MDPLSRDKSNDKSIDDSRVAYTYFCYYINPDEKMRPIRFFFLFSSSCFSLLRHAKGAQNAAGEWNAERARPPSQPRGV